jgi:hypothetical protein
MGFPFLLLHRLLPLLSLALRNSILLPSPPLSLATDTTALARGADVALEDITEDGEEEMVIAHVGEGILRARMLAPPTFTVRTIRPL